MGHCVVKRKGKKGSVSLLIIPGVVDRRGRALPTSITQSKEEALKPSPQRNRVQQPHTWQ